MEHKKLTSIIPLMTQGNEFRGEIKVLNRARQVKTCRLRLVKKDNKCIFLGKSTIAENAEKEQTGILL